MGNFSIALSGLQANSVALNTIGNNLANLNTTAYKGQNTSFENLFYQQIGQQGSGDAIQVGAGVKVSGTATDYTQGTILPDSNINPSDMALTGNGFFVVQQAGQQTQELTRAGNFQVSNNGNLITQEGLQVLGYPAVAGVINPNAQLAPINLPVGVTQGAQATQNFSITANLDSGATNGTQFVSPITVYDSLGQSHQASVTYQKTALNTWNYTVSLPATDGTPIAGGANTGTLSFNTNGTLNYAASLPAPPAVGAPGYGSESPMQFTMLDGSAPLSFSWNLLDAAGNGTVTQLASASSNNTGTQDGYTSGVYQKFTVDTSGVVTAQFSNGRSQTIAQVAVAAVANVEGLTVAGNNDFTTTNASGLAAVGVAGTGGRAGIQDGALEQSNVNISTEFSDLIVAQRAFEANSKTMTTFDTVSQDAISMIR